MNTYECNICGWLGDAFKDIYCGYGVVIKNVLCPRCSSASRHRSFHLFLKNFIPECVHLKVLHFAPEKCLTDFLQSYSNIDYLSVDIKPNKAMQVEDITQLSFPDESFDMVLCFHVLEHIEDDHKAIKELYRVLKKDSFAIIDAPVYYGLETTYEDPEIVLPQDRAKAFNQWDHVRVYGEDFSDRIEQKGFRVEKDFYIKSLGGDVIKRHNLMETPIHLCTK